MRGNYVHVVDEVPKTAQWVSNSPVSIGTQDESNRNQTKHFITAYCKEEARLTFHGKISSANCSLVKSLATIKASLVSGPVPNIRDNGAKDLEATKAAQNQRTELLSPLHLQAASLHAFPKAEWLHVVTPKCVRKGGCSSLAMSRFPEPERRAIHHSMDIPRMLVTCLEAAPGMASIRRCVVSPGNKHAEPLTSGLGKGAGMQDRRSQGLTG